MSKSFFGTLYLQYSSDTSPQFFLLFFMLQHFTDQHKVEAITLPHSLAEASRFMFRFSFFFLDSYQDMLEKVEKQKKGITHTKKAILTNGTVE